MTEADHQQYAHMTDSQSAAVCDTGIVPVRSKQAQLSVRHLLRRSLVLIGSSSCRLIVSVCPVAQVTVSVQSGPNPPPPCPLSPELKQMAGLVKAVDPVRWRRVLPAPR